MTARAENFVTREAALHAARRYSHPVSAPRATWSAASRAESFSK